ncbi:kinase-like domain-containing protein [Syncephalis pseudoplumigaleata]|uniref:Kinase-like domain-containing protein n=1 Tax=Syncephalis pseudoplumigaleata TaxID=1712513 RepID=A0A4P9YUP6_9FUNG|nr:kinase-like domain-containing protein [Syncephalis pseudoplumigaleata]|eukprot:RKP22931.1 kinase-like domain-containing protein [Syncephalis pseudoplumigaleata]
MEMEKTTLEKVQEGVFETNDPRCKKLHYAHTYFFKYHRQFRTAIPIFYQLLASVSYLHCLGIAHMDIKLENILIHNTKALVPMIKLRGTPGYIPPESYLMDTYDIYIYGYPMDALMLVDSWSIAATMYNLLVGITPYVRDPWLSVSDTASSSISWSPRSHAPDPMEAVGENGPPRP